MYSTMPSPTARTARPGAMIRAACALAVAFAATFASGCGLLSGTLERGAKGAGKAVTYYCENVTIPEIREEVRAAVNKYAAPHKVEVTCSNGGPTLDSTAPANPAAPPTAAVLDYASGELTAWKWADVFRLPILIFERAPTIVIHNS